MAKALTVKQEKFIQKYLECGNASEAYRFAYNCENMKPATIGRKATEALNNGTITAYLERLRGKAEEAAGLKISDIMALLTRVITADVTEYVKPDGTIRAQDILEMPLAQRQLIESIKPKRGGMVELTIMSKMAAIERVCKILGYDAPTKVDANLTANFDLQKIRENTTPEQLAALAALGKTSLPQ